MATLIRVVDVLTSARAEADKRVIHALKQIKELRGELRSRDGNTEQRDKDAEQVIALADEVESENKLVRALSLLQQNASLSLIEKDGAEYLRTWPEAEHELACGRSAKAVAVKDFRHYYLVAETLKVSKHQPTLELARSLCQAIRDVNEPPPVSP